MFGDIVYVERRPTGLRSTKKRENKDSKLIDRLIYRTIPYRHYGIEVEDNYVVHFHASSFRLRKTSSIKKVKVEEFLLGGELKVLGHLTNAYSNEVTAERAYSALGKVELPYSINNNNCEHFVYWCSTGKRYSTQTYLINKGQVVMMLPNKAVLLTIKTKDKTIRTSITLYNKILRRA